MEEIVVEPAWRERLRSIAGDAREIRLIAAVVACVVLVSLVLWARRAPAQIAPPARATESPSIQVVLVHVAGLIRRPGLYEFPAGARVADAIETAGGAKPGADLTAVNLAAQLVDGTQVVIPRRSNSPVSAAPAPEPSAAVVHLNSADEAALETIPRDRTGDGCGDRPASDRDRRFLVDRRVARRGRDRSRDARSDPTVRGALSALRLWLSVGALGLGALFGVDAPPIAGVVPAAAGICLLCLRRHPNLTLAGLMLLAAGGGCLGAALRARDGAGLETAVTGVTRCSVAGRVLEQAGGLGTLVALDAIDCGGERLPSGVAVVSTDRPPASGSGFTGEGWLIPLGPDGFSRRRAAAGARAEFEPIQIDVAAPSGAWSVVAAFRNGIEGTARDALPARHAALLLGLTIGDTSRISVRDMDLFRSSGLAHLLAVSGSNVAIVLGTVAGFARRTTYRVRLMTTFVAAALFVAIVGPDASVLRAAAMGTIAFVAAGWVRPVDPLHSLPFALLVIVAARPWMVDSAGLHLSVAATAGIVLWSQPIGARLTSVPGAIGGPLAVTLAAQFAVAPVLILTFGTLPVVAPAANLLAAPAVVFATLVGMGAMVIAPVLAVPAGWLLTTARPALAWLLWVAETCGGPTWSSVELSRWVGWVAVVAVAGAALATLRRRASRP